MSVFERDGYVLRLFGEIHPNDVIPALWQRFPADQQQVGYTGVVYYHAYTLAEAIEAANRELAYQGYPTNGFATREALAAILSADGKEIVIHTSAGQPVLLYLVDMDEP